MEPTDAYLHGQRPIMKSAPFKPRPWECRFDGAFPKQPARGLSLGTDANLPTDPWAKKDYQAGRLMMLTGSAIGAIGSLTLMGMKPKRKQGTSGKVRRVIQGLVFTVSVVTVWSILDSDIRQSAARALKGTQTGE